MEFIEVSFRILCWIGLAMCGYLTVIHLYNVLVKFRTDRLGRSVEYVNLVTFALIAAGIAFVVPGFDSTTVLPPIALLFACAGMVAVIPWMVFAWNATRHGVGTASRHARDAAMLVMLSAVGLVAPLLLLGLATYGWPWWILPMPVLGVFLSAAAMYGVLGRLSRTTDEVVG